MQAYQAAGRLSAQVCYNDHVALPGEKGILSRIYRRTDETTVVCHTGLSVLALCSGCVAATVAGAGAGVGVYSYIQGELQATYKVPIEKAWPKTLAAMDELKLTVDRQLIDHLGGEIDARRVDGTRSGFASRPLTIKRPSVRVGNFGNRQHSERVHEIIQKQLVCSTRPVQNVECGMEHNKSRNFHSCTVSQ